MFSSETKTFGVFALLLLVSGLAALGGMLYVVRQKDTAYEDQLRARAIRTATKDEVESLDNLIIDTATDREELMGYVLTEDSVVDFLSLVGDRAEAQGVAMETRSLAVEPIPGSEVFERLTFKVDVTGSFNNVIRMLSVLESMPYQIHVRTVSLESTDTASGNALWRGSYHLYVTKYK